MKTAQNLDVHKQRALVGLPAGLLLLAVTAYQCHETWLPGKGTVWAWLLVPALALVAWGCSHLARHRGYPSSAAYGIVLVALPVSGGIGMSQTPLTIAVACGFAGVMPTVLLLALPKRFGALRRK